MRQSAYETAKVEGKPHHRWLLIQRKLPTAKLLKGIRSLQKQSALHAQWIADPYLKFPSDADPCDVSYHRKIKWPNDIARQREQIEILEGVINERTDKK